MKQFPKISIITPSYNQASYLEQTIQSVLDQGYPELEYMIIDGGSTDGSVEIIHKYAHRLAYWVSEPDSGQSEAINKGFHRATGDIVAWINSDDFYLSGTFFRVAEELADPSIDGVYSDCPIVDSSGMQIGCFKGDYFSWERLLEKNMLPQPTVFLKRKILEQVGLLDTDLNYVMDLEWWMRMAVLGKNLRYLPGCNLACFRISGLNKTTLFQERFFDEILNVYSKLFSSACCFPLRKKAYAFLHMNRFLFYLREGYPQQQKQSLLEFLEYASKKEEISLAYHLACEEEVVFSKACTLLIHNRKLLNLLTYYRYMRQGYEAYLKGEQQQFLFLALRGFLCDPLRFLGDRGNIKRLLRRNV